MSRKQRKVPFRVTDGKHTGGYIVRTAAAAVAAFRYQFRLPVDRTQTDHWHGLHVAAVGEVTHFPQSRQDVSGRMPERRSG